MSFRHTCPFCSAAMTVVADEIGRTARCAHCEAEVRVPPGAREHPVTEAAPRPEPTPGSATDRWHLRLQGAAAAMLLLAMGGVGGFVLARALSNQGPEATRVAPDAAPAEPIRPPLHREPASPPEAAPVPAEPAAPAGVIGPEALAPKPGPRGTEQAARAKPVEVALAAAEPPADWRAAAKPELVIPAPALVPDPPIVVPPPLPAPPPLPGDAPLLALPNPAQVPGAAPVPLFAPPDPAPLPPLAPQVVPEPLALPPAPPLGPPVVQPVTPRPAPLPPPLPPVRPLPEMPQAFPDPLPLLPLPDGRGLSPDPTRG